MQGDSPPSVFETAQSHEKSSKHMTYVQGEVIVDFGAWNQWGPGDDTPDMGDNSFLVMDSSDWHSSAFYRYGKHTVASKTVEDKCKTCDLLDHEYALLPPRVLGYIPYKRMFAQLAVKHIKSINDTNQDEAWGNGLVLDVEKKTIIRALVENHAKMAGERTPDLLEGKGNGLVILVHGAPGVGKSLTAECVARATSQPLFTVGVADIGTSSGTVEDKLNRLFSLAADWDAVLLIDEADVFIEHRGSSDATLERNALVSVLLRVFEYYEGILILMTTRVLSLDVAV